MKPFWLLLCLVLGIAVCSCQEETRNNRSENDSQLQQRAAASGTQTSLDPRIKPSIFSAPREVPILGLPMGSESRPLSTEEPFLKLSGNRVYLFFNSHASERNRDLHFAILESTCANKQPLCFNYKGELGPFINTANHLEGAPSMDDENNLYFIDSTDPYMVKVGRFYPLFNFVGIRTSVMGMPRFEYSATGFFANMDAEVSPRGTSFYFSRGYFASGNTAAPTHADIHYARRGWAANVAVYDSALSDSIMKNINTADHLEYAPAISRDELELFFVRVRSQDVGVRSQIFQAVRRSMGGPFEVFGPVASIGDQAFIEAPTLSPDGKSLYYHKLVDGKFRIFAVDR